MQAISAAERLAKILINVASSVPHLPSPALYKAWASAWHWFISGFGLLLLLHCNKATNKSLKFPEVSP